MVPSIDARAAAEIGARITDAVRGNGMRSALATARPDESARELLAQTAREPPGRRCAGSGTVVAQDSASHHSDARART